MYTVCMYKMMMLLSNQLLLFSQSLYQSGAKTNKSAKSSSFTLVRTGRGGGGGPVASEWPLQLFITILIKGRILALKGVLHLHLG